MKKIILSVLVLGLFSCSSNMKNNDSDRTVSSDEDYAKIVELFKQPRILFDVNAKSVKRNADRTLAMLQSNADVVECKKTSAKSFLSNSCKKALEACEKTQVNVFGNVHTNFMEIISKTALKAEADLVEKLSSDGNNKELKSLREAMKDASHKIHWGSNEVANKYYASSDNFAKGVSGKKNKLELCESRLQAEISIYDELKASYDALIPQ